jgi:hypothetical protein
MSRPLGHIKGIEDEYITQQPGDRAGARRVGGRIELECGYRAIAIEGAKDDSGPAAADQPHRRRCRA